MAVDRSATCAETIKREAHASLDHSQSDHVRLYYAHFDDEQTPLAESLRAFDALVQAGAARCPQDDGGAGPELGTVWPPSRDTGT